MFEHFTPLTMNTGQCTRLCSQTVSITLSGVQGRDAGVLSCGKLGAEYNETATVSLVVLGKRRSLRYVVDISTMNA